MLGRQIQPYCQFLYSVLRARRLLIKIVFRVLQYISKKMGQCTKTRGELLNYLRNLDEGTPVIKHPEAHARA